MIGRKGIFGNIGNARPPTARGAQQTSQRDAMEQAVQQYRQHRQQQQPRRQAQPAQNGQAPLASPFSANIPGGMEGIGVRMPPFLAGGENRPDRSVRFPVLAGGNEQGMSRNMQAVVAALLGAGRK